MPLILTVLRCPENVPPETRTITGGEFTVGRGPGVDWVLPDPERLLSKRHFVVAYRGGAWQIADTSTNGTTLNRDAGPIGRESLRTLRDGDRLSLGAYEIEVRLAEDAASQLGFGAGFGRPAGRDANPFADPFGLDPLAPPPPPRRPFDEQPEQYGFSPGGAQLPPDFDPLVPDPNPAPFLGPTQEDHRPVLEDAFRPPSIGLGQLPPAGGRLPNDAMLPDDWEKDLLSGITPAARLAPSASPATRPPPPAAPSGPASPSGPALGPGRASPSGSPSPPPPVPPPPQVQRGPAPPTWSSAAAEADPFAEPDEPGLARVPDAPASSLAPTPFDEPFDLEPQPEPPPEPSPPMPAQRSTQGSAQGPAQRSAQAPTPQPASQPSPQPASQPAPQPASPGPGDAALLAAFLQGAGMDDVAPTDPVVTMRRLGAAFRALVAGLRAVLIARASIKSEFRIEQTMIRARGNNPLKFSAGDDDALAALLGTGRRTDMTAAEAVADALKDIKLHELASMTAMQTAVRTLLEGLDPARLRAQAEQGALSVLPAQRKARAWDAYEALHSRTVQALADDFDSVFGKAFARAYERALDDIAAEEK